MNKVTDPHKRDFFALILVHFSFCALVAIWLIYLVYFYEPPIYGA
jgi:hypothetical protein